MATISTAERNTTIDALLTRHGENAAAVAMGIKALGSIPTLTIAAWITILTARVALHSLMNGQGLSQTWWIAEVTRQANA